MEVLGIDVGGSGIKAAIVETTTGELVTDRFRLDTPNPSTPVAVTQTICDIIAHFDWKGQVG